MAAPSGTQWGSIVGNYGRIGIYISLTNTATTTVAKAEVWFWSKYSISDTSNTYKFDFNDYDQDAISTIGSLSIATTVDTGSGWSTSNQIRIGTHTSQTFTRGTSNVTKYAAAGLNNVDRVGDKMRARVSFTVPKLDTYTVSYNANGGSGAPSSQTKTHGNTLTLSSTKPTRTGYTFQGWATSSSGSVAYAAGASYTTNASVTLYAVWKANTYTVSYNANGGTGAPGNQTKTYGVTLTLSSTKPTRTNYTFKGWGTSASATTVSYAAGASYTANAGITLYAVWELTYTSPRITNVSTIRCTSDGSADDNGTYALVTFDWATDYNVTSITIQWRQKYGSDWTVSAVSASGTSGRVSRIVGSGSLSTEYTYEFNLIVVDSGGSSYKYASIDGAKIVIDIRQGATGIAFGKRADVYNVMDVAYSSAFRGLVELHDQTMIMNDKAIWGETTDGQYLRMLGMSTSNNTILGYGGYDKLVGATNVYGNAINLYSKNNVTINSTLQLTKTTDASGTANNAPALMIGDIAGTHLEFDGNEIMAKGSGTNTAGLSINADGGNVNIGKSGSSTVYINGCKMAANTVLWSGVYYMSASHTATLSQSISSQANGIVLLWSYYSGGAQDYAYTTTFLPKYLVNVIPSDGGITVRLNTRTFNTFGVKYIYMTDTAIRGHDSNSSSAWTSTAGPVITPAGFVLRYIIGV